MIDYLKVIADKLIVKNLPVILYGAGSDAMFIILRLKRQYSVLPTYLCDSDVNKYHKRIQGVEILSLDEALSICPDAYFFVSSRTYKYDIIGTLLVDGEIPKEHIINYEPVVQRRSCRYIENDIVVGNQRLSFCCSDFGKNQSPSVEFSGNYEHAANGFTNLRDKLISDLCHEVPTICGDCPCIRTSYYAVDPKIRLYSFSENGICNFECVYCTVASKHAVGINDNSIDCGKMLNVLNRLGATSEEYSVDLAPGEITVHPNRNQIFDNVEYSTDIILTNASIYDERIARILKERGRLYISIDAGTRATFKRVKGVDLFDKVRENLKRYKDAVGFAPYELKYIFMPDVNESDADVDGFVEFCKDVGTNNVLISYDFNAPQPNEKTVLTVKRLMEKLIADDISYSIISDVISNAIYR